MKKQTSILIHVAVIGFVGGLVCSFFGYVAYFFHLVKVNPSIILDPFVVKSWREGIFGNVLSMFIISVLSICVAFLYYALLRKKMSFFVGIIFGACLWGIVFYGVSHVIPAMDALKETDRNGIVTSICLYVLYGVFIGYSISFQESEKKAS